MKKIESEHGSVIISGEDHENVNVDLESLYDKKLQEDETVPESTGIYFKIGTHEFSGRLLSLKVKKYKIKINYEASNESLSSINELLCNGIFLKEVKTLEFTIKPKDLIFKSFELQPNQVNQQYSYCSLVFE